MSCSSRFDPESLVQQSGCCPGLPPTRSELCFHLKVRLEFQLTLKEQRRSAQEPDWLPEFQEHSKQVGFVRFHYRPCR